MHRIVLVAAVALLGIAGAAFQAGVLAQDATPAQGPPEEEGVTFLPVGFAPGVDLPSTADLIAVRITLEPGAVSTFLKDDPTGGMAVVESGAITVRVDGADWPLTRNDDDPFGEPEIVASGEEATLTEGDTAYIPGNVAGELRNDGDSPAEAFAVLFAPGGTLGGGEPEGTPAG
jgi:quercetin dioxygenase-like cupin family protein